MSIATQIERLKNAKESLKAKLIAKGVTISDDATLDQYADFVDEIETGITPTGQLEVTSNGIYDVTNYAKANVNVTPKLQSKTVTSNGTVTPDSGYDGLSRVTVNVASSGSSSGNTLKTLLDATKSTYYLFYNYSGSSVSDLISYSDTENVTNTYGMFFHCKYLTALPALNFSKSTTMSQMFDGCAKLTQLPRLVTTNVTNFSGTFEGCNVIKTIDISYYNVSSTSYSSRFCYNCYSLTALIIRGIGMNYTINSDAFTKCYHLTGTTNSYYNPNGDKDCYIYVPKAKVSTLKSATNWSTYASQIRALENFTVDGTVNGDLDPDKVASGGSGGESGGGTTGGYTVAINISNTNYADMTGLSYSLDNGTSYTKLSTSTTVQNVKQIMFKISNSGGMQTSIVVGSTTYTLGMSAGYTTSNITISSNQTINITYGHSGGGGYD